MDFDVMWLWRDMKGFGLFVIVDFKICILLKLNNLNGFNYK